MEKEKLEEIEYWGVPQELWHDFKNMIEEIKFDFDNKIHLKADKLVLIDMPSYSHEESMSLLEHEVREDLPDYDYPFPSSFESIEIELDDILFTFKISNETFIFGLGNGCTIGFQINLNENNKEKIINFYHKWDDYKKERPDKYNF